MLAPQALSIPYHIGSVCSFLRLRDYNIGWWQNMLVGAGISIAPDPLNRLDITQFILVSRAEMGV